MTPVEILALIVALLVAVKLLVVLINPGSWVGVVKRVYVKPLYTMSIALLLAVVTLRYLLVEMTIIQIFAVMAFMSALMMFGAATFSNEIAELSEKLLQDKKAIKKACPAIAVWLILIVWVLFDLFV